LSHLLHLLHLLHLVVGGRGRGRGTGTGLLQSSWNDSWRAWDWASWCAESVRPPRNSQRDAPHLISLLHTSPHHH
jgi:hypothetical protein